MKSPQIPAYAGEGEDRKASLRKEAKALRRSMPPAERAVADAAICGRVLESPAFGEAGTVFSYLSFDDEVDTYGIIRAAWANGKTVALPRCVGPRTMRWFAVSDFDDLEAGAFGIREPRIVETAEVMPSSCESAVALVPGLLFDGEGYRLGYGGGFYDTFLAEFPGISMGLCRRAQLSEAPLPRGRFDRRVDLVISDGISLSGEGVS